jgi:putative Mg2+ transporter-C (MgtC) family protein
MTFSQMGIVGIRLLITILLSGCIGWNREHTKPGAGFRTHMLVGIAAASFMMLGFDFTKSYTQADPMRIIQGVAMGIGFLGAGTILQIPQEHRVQGLTTAASLWATSAIGLAVGAGRIGFATMIVVMTMLVLIVLRKLEAKYKSQKGKKDISTSW